jgi:uncharacterized protein (TIGR03118 family)
MEDKAKNSFEGSESSGRRKLVIASATLITVLMLAFSGCKKSEEELAMIGDDHAALTESMRSSFGTVCLVSDVTDYSPAHIDPLLVNAWGLSFGSGGEHYVSATANGVSTVYDANGNVLLRPISVVSGAEGSRRGKPTASVYNSIRRAFIVPATGESASVIYATEDGTIAAWSSGSAAYTVVDRSAVNAVYKGLAITTRNGAWYLYATDFYNSRIDVFDARFNYMGALGGQFRDPEMPANYGPFGIRAFGEKLVVTYAAHASGRLTDAPGPGRGFVSFFKSDGRLNSPWGIEIFRTGTQTPDMSADVERRAILIGNSGDGRITVYAPDGTYMGQLSDNNMPVTIDGLKAISYKPGALGENKIFFTAAPRASAHGMFGYLRY